jgi:hypothetical protein
MDRDKKAENARTIRLLCFGCVFLMLFSAILLLTRGWLEQGIVLLAVGIALLPIAIAIGVALGKTSSPSTS